MDPLCLQVRLLGAFDLRLGRTPLPPPESARARSLLAYLLLHRDAPQPRQHIAFLLWPDSTEAQARTNLRHLLHTLRRAVPALAPLLLVGTRTLGWRADAPVWLDVAAFDDALARGRSDDDDGVAALREAAALYRGDLLEECYDEWISPHRERMRRGFLGALARLAALLEGRGEHAPAIDAAERLLAREPCDEAAYRLLMRLHAGRGDRARALRAYHLCASTLERELGVAPSAETREAYEALLPPEPEAPDPGRDAGRATPPLVGRAAPWQRLTAAWRAAERGRAGLVLLSGEAGIGKTRLVEELRDWCAHQGAATAEARAYAAEGAVAYGQVAAWLRSAALRPLLPGLDPAALTEIARLVPELLREVPRLPPPAPLPESEQRRRLFAALAAAVLATGGPLLLVADDVHWSDRESLRFLHHLLRTRPDARLLVAATARREEMDERGPLADLLLGLQRLERCTEIELARLTREETAALGERLAGRPMEAATAGGLYAETEGNPLFVVEAMRAGWGGPGRRWESPRVQAAIQARLAQLSEPARALAGIAATVGREFTAELLERASGGGGEAFLRPLDELWRARIIREHASHAYDFSHHKIREVAYAALGPVRRSHYHLAVARALERQHAMDPGAVSARIAAHYDHAGAAGQAVTWYEAAAEAAQRLFASTEAIRFLERALELLATLPPSVEREARELANLTSLVAPLATVEGFGSARLAAAQRRALELAAALRVDAAPQLLRSLAVRSLAAGDPAEARRYGEHLLARGRDDADDVLTVEASYVLGIAAFWQGELRAARGHFESAVARYRPEHLRAHLDHYGMDPHVVCLSRLANTLGFLGRVAEAVRARDAAVAQATELGHPQTRGTVLVFAGLLSVELDEVERLRGYLASLHGSVDAAESVQVRLGAEALHGYLTVRDGDAPTGLERIRRALAESGGVDHAPGLQAVVLRLLLAACEAMPDAREGLAAAERALAPDQRTPLWEAETRRARAGFLATLGAPGAEVEAELRLARRVARRQGARLVDRRIDDSLARLLHRPPRDGVSDPLATR